MSLRNENAFAGGGAGLRIPFGFRLSFLLYTGGAGGGGSALLVEFEELVGCAATMLLDLCVTVVFDDPATSREAMAVLSSAPFITPTLRLFVPSSLIVARCTANASLFTEV